MNDNLDHAPTSDLTYQDVLNILRLIDSGPFSDFQIEFEGTKLRVTRRSDTTPVRTKQANESTSSTARPAEQAKKRVAATPGLSPQVSDKPASVPDSPTHAELPNRVDVKPPMAGTYYAALSPGAAPFAEVGGSVKKGDRLGIVEVMKLFTPVFSPCDGIVRAILIENQAFVQSDQTLMIIEAMEQ